MPTKLIKVIKTKSELAEILKIDLSHLEQVSKEKQKHYRKITELKNGKERVYSVADKILGQIHQSIDRNILNKLDFPKEINGGIKGRSRSTNAIPHIGSSNLAHFDIRNFYPSTKPSKVFVSFRSLSIWTEPAKLLTSLTTTDHLPIGFATSTKISALILTKLNRRLGPFLKKFGIKHTLWVDDLTLSGDYPIKKLHPVIKTIIEDEGYTLNEKKSDKSKIAYKRQAQVVTGININNDLSAERAKVDQVKRVIYVSRKFGACKYIDTNEVGISTKELKEKMAGRLGNLLSINKVKYKPLQDSWKKIIAEQKL